MGCYRTKRRQHRAVFTKSPKTGPMRKAQLPRKQLVERKRHESPLPWLFDCLGEKHVVLLAKRGKIFFSTHNLLILKACISGIEFTVLVMCK